MAKTLGLRGHLLGELEELQRHLAQEEEEAGERGLGGVEGEGGGLGGGLAGSVGGWMMGGVALIVGDIGIICDIVMII